MAGVVVAGRYRVVTGPGGWGCDGGAGAGGGVASRVIAVRVGDVEVLAETVPVAGTEPTAGRAGKAVEHASEAFDRAQDVIVGVAMSTAAMIGKAAAQAARPDRVEIEFGLKFSATGNVIIGGVTSEATLRVLLSYDGKSPAMDPGLPDPGPASEAGAAAREEQ